MNIHAHHKRKRVPDERTEAICVQLINGSILSNTTLLCKMLRKILQRNNGNDSCRLPIKYPFRTKLTMATELIHWAHKQFSPSNKGMTLLIDGGYASNEVIADARKTVM